MRTPLSQNELVILDRKMADISRQLTEIAALLESRLGDEAIAMSARTIEQGFTDLARKIHNQAGAAVESLPLQRNSQTA